MKKILFCGAALLLLAGCQNKSEKLETALEQMELSTSGKGRTTYSDKSVSGDQVVLENVVIDTTGIGERIESTLEGAENFNIVTDLYSSNIQVKKLTFDGLKMDADNRAIFENVLFEGLKIVPIEDPEAVGLYVENMKLEGTSPELSAWLAAMFQKKSDVKAPKPDKLTFKSLKMDGLVWLDEDLPVEHASTLKSLKIEDVKDDKVGALSLEGLKVKFFDAYSPEPGEFSIADLNLKGSNVAFLQAAQEKDPFASASDISKSVLQTPLDDGIDEAQLKDLEFALDGVELKLPELKYSVERNTSGMPLSSRLEPVNLSFKADPEAGLLGAQLSPYLSAYGVDDLKITTGYSSTYDPKTDLAQTKDSYIEVENAFRLSYDFSGSGVKKLQEKLQSVDPDLVLSGEKSAKDVMADLYSELDIHALTMTLEDQGAVNKLVALAAIMRGLSPDDVRKSVNGIMAFGMVGALMLGVDEGILQEFGDASRGFIEKGGTVTLSMTPTEPVSLSTLMDKPSQVKKDTLGFSMIHTPPEAE